MSAPSHGSTLRHSRWLCGPPPAGDGSAGRLRQGMALRAASGRGWLCGLPPAGDGSAGCLRQGMALRAASGRGSRCGRVPRAGPFAGACVRHAAPWCVSNCAAGTRRRRCRGGAEAPTTWCCSPRASCVPVRDARRWTAGDGSTSRSSIWCARSRVVMRRTCLRPLQSMNETSDVSSSTTEEPPARCGSHSDRSRGPHEQSSSPSTLSSVPGRSLRTRVSSTFSMSPPHPGFLGLRCATPSSRLRRTTKLDPWLREKASHPSSRKCPRRRPGRPPLRAGNDADGPGPARREHEVPQRSGA